MPVTVKRAIRVRGRMSGGNIVGATTVKTYSRRRATKSFAKVVRGIAKSVVSRAAEDKFVSVNSVTRHNSTISSPGECYPMVPQVTLGTGDYQRIGDKISGKYLYIKGYIQYDSSVLDLLQTAQSLYLPPSTVRVLCLSQKNVKVGSAVPTAIDVNHLIKDNVGTGTARAYTGSVFDNVAPINKDLFKVHMDKKIKLNFQSTNTVAPATGPGLQTAMVGNDRTKYFTCRIKCPASMKFDDGNGDWPNSFAPFICMGAVCDDGTAPWSLSTPYRLTVSSTLYFEDS